MKNGKGAMACMASGIVVCLICACSQTVDHTIAGGIKNALPNAIGTAQNYDVKVSSDPLDAAKGHLHEVDIVGTEVNLSPQILVDQLNIQAMDIDADVTTQHVKSVGTVNFQAQIGQDSVNHYLAQLAPDSPQRQEKLSVVINDHSVTATVMVKVLGLDVPASVTGTFRLEQTNPRALDFVPDSGSVSIVSIPQFALRLAITKVNPVIDLTTSTVPVTAQTVSIQSGKVVITGQADLQHGLTQNT